MKISFIKFNTDLISRKTKPRKLNLEEESDEEAEGENDESDGEPEEGQGTDDSQEELDEVLEVPESAAEVEV